MKPELRQGLPPSGPIPLGIQTTEGVKGDAAPVTGKSRSPKEAKQTDLNGTYRKGSKLRVRDENKISLT